MELNRLACLRGPEFDREFVSRMVLDHQKNLQAFKNLAQDAREMDVKQYASKTVPVLEKHLERAKQLQGTPATSKTDNPEAQSAKQKGAKTQGQSEKP